MKIGLISALCLVLTALAPIAVASSTDEVELRAREQQLNEAFRRGERATLQQILTPDWKLITSTGRVKGRAAVLDEVADPRLQFETNAAEQVEVRQYGDSAVLTGVLHQRYVYDGQPREHRVWYTDTWIKRDGRWWQVSGHASPYPTAQ